MSLHLKTLGDAYWTHIEVKYVEPLGHFTLDELKEKEIHTTIMDALASTLSYYEYKDVAELETTYEMWEKLKVIHGGDKHVMRENFESL